MASFGCESVPPEALTDSIVNFDSVRLWNRDKHTDGFIVVSRRDDPREWRTSLIPECVAPRVEHGGGTSDVLMHATLQEARAAMHPRVVFEQHWSITLARATQPQALCQ